MARNDNLDGVLSPFLRRQRNAAARPFIAGRVLDYGCGIGMIAGFPGVTDYAGVDADREILEVARRAHPGRLFLHPDDVAEGLAGRAFDTVVGLAIIEHLADPIGFLKEMRSFLAPSGKVVLTTPNPALDWAHGLGSRLGIFARESHDEHQSLMGRKKLAAAAAAAGLKLATYRRFLFGANQLVVLTR